MSLPTTSPRTAREQTQEALQALPPDQAAALLLAAQSGMTYRQVAARLGVDPVVVLRWLSDGMRSMRAQATGLAWT